MEAVVITNPGQGVEAWSVVARERPSAGPGEVVVRMRAVSLNYRDLMIALGRYGGPARSGLVVASDGAGVVDEVGAGVTGVRVGDRVMSAYYPTWRSGPYSDRFEDAGLGIGRNDGVLAGFAVLRAEGVVRIPDAISFEAASTIPCAAVTAYQGLFEGSRKLLPGATVLVQGTGGVSIFAAQLAKAAGMRVIATTSNEARSRRLRDLGVTEVIDRSLHPAWETEAQRFTGGEGVDLVLDVGGGATLASSIASTRNGGRIALVGMLGGFAATIDPLPILFRGITVDGIHVGSVETSENTVRAIEAASIAPVIDTIFELGEAPRALAKLAAAAHVGKLVIRVG